MSLTMSIGRATIACAWVSMSTPLAAQIVHPGDVHPAVRGGQLVVQDVRPIDGITGAPLYAGDFGDLSGGPHSTDDPGYESPNGVLLANSLLGVRGSGLLLFWNGTAWGTAAPGVTVTIEDALGSFTTFSGTGVSNPNAYVGQASASGALHEHLEMAVNPSAPTGAYLFTLHLFAETSPTDPTAPYSPSAPFAFVMNRGLSPAAFQAAVDARLGPTTQADVPLPIFATVLLLIGFGSIGVSAVRSRQ